MARSIIILSALLLAAVLVSAVVIWLLPAQDSSNQETPGASAPHEFDTAVLQRAEYLRLDRKPVHDGALPVQPPAALGKANPFL